jgi:hypothetical protein
MKLISILVFCSYLVQGCNSGGVGRFFEELELRPSAKAKQCGTS